MVTKKSNVKTINFSDTNIVYFQMMGFLDKRKKVLKSKNFSKFINECVNAFRGVHDISQERALSEKLLLMELNTKQKVRNRMDDDILLLSNKITELRKKFNDEIK